MSVEDLAVLLGRWELTGRSAGEEHDDISGSMTGTAILGGTVLHLAGRMRVGEHELESLELIWADESTGDFAAHVYSTAGEPRPYRWARTGPNTLRHAGSGATYDGTISEDGRTITGQWLPDPGQLRHPGSAYTATMRRVD
jgi:hypothetical protein